MSEWVSEGEENKRGGEQEMRNTNRNRNKNKAENGKRCVLTQTHATPHTPQLELTMCLCCDAAPKTNAHCPTHTHTHSLRETLTGQAEKRW